VKDAPQLRTASASKLYTFRTPITAVRLTYGCRSFRPRWIGDICMRTRNSATRVPRDTLPLQHGAQVALQRQSHDRCMPLAAACTALQQIAH